MQLKAITVNAFYIKLNKVHACRLLVADLH